MYNEKNGKAPIGELPNNIWSDPTQIYNPGHKDYYKNKDGLNNLGAVSANIEILNNPEKYPPKVDGLGSYDPAIELKQSFLTEDKNVIDGSLLTTETPTKNLQPYSVDLNTNDFQVKSLNKLVNIS